MKKRIAFFALAVLLLCAVLTACTGGKSEDGTTATAGEQTTGAPTGAPTGTEAATGDGWTKSY